VRIGGEEAGLGLVEVVVAVMVLTISVLALASGAVQSLASLGESKQRQLGTVAATRSLETVRSYPYNLIALQSNQAPAGTTFDPDGAGPLAAEPVVRTLNGAVTGGVHQATTAGVAVETWVTAYDDPVLSGTENARRVTAVASWTRGGTTKVVRESTVVSEASRGQTAAAFSLAPSAPQTRTITSESPDPTCFAHTITNNGGNDRYDVTLPTVAAYEVFAYGDMNGDNLGDLSERLVDQSGDGRPDTPQTVLQNGTFPLLICYRPLGAGTTVSASVTVRSTVDPSVARTMSHALSLTASPTPSPSPSATASPSPTPTSGGSTTFYLHDPNVTADHDRVLDTIYVMDTTGPSATTLYNYDRNQDPDDVPGLFIKKAETQYDGQWMYQYPAATTLSGQSDLILYLTWRDALLQSRTDLKNIQIKVTVQRRATNGTTVNQTLVNGVSIAAPHAQAGWKELIVTLDLPTADFAAGEYLHVRVGCASVSEEECLLAYDTTAYPSSFTVRSQ